MDVSKFIKNMGINSIPNANYNPEEEDNKEPKGLILPDINAKSNQTLDMALRNQLYGWSVDPNKVNKYHRYGINWSPNIAGESLDRQLAEAQGAMEKLWHGVEQGVVGEIGLGTAIAFSDMFDAIGQAIGTSDHDYSNPLTRQLEAWKEQFNNEVAPIYTTPGVDILHGGLADAGWWASQMPSILTSVSLLIPARAVTAGISLVGKGANLARAARIASKAKKLENAAKVANEGQALQAATTGTAKAFNRINSIKAVQNTAKALGRVEDYALSTRGWETIKHGANIAVTGAMQRTLENYQEARQVYDDVYVSALDSINKMSDDQYNSFLEKNAQILNDVDKNNKVEVAKAIAKKSADKTFLIDYLNTGFDILQLYGLRNLPFKGFRNTSNRFNRSVIKDHLNSIKYAGKTADEVVDILSKRTTKEKIKDFFGGFGYTAKALLPQTSEGVEEIINYIAQQEGMNVGHVLLGMSDDSRFSKRLEEYVKEAGLWESAFWGVLGGVTFEGLGSGYFKGRNAISKAINAKRNQIDPITGEKVNMPGWTALFELPETKRSKQEIESRYTIFKKYVDDVLTIRGGHNPYIQDEEGNNKTINEADKTVLENKAFDDMVTSMTFNALDSGNFSLLKEYLSSEEVKQALVDKGVVSKANADKLQQQALQLMDGIAKKYDDNLIALDSVAMRINAEQDSPIPLEYLQIIARNNLSHQVNIEEWQRQLDVYELDSREKEEFYRKHGKLNDGIDYKNTIRLAFLTEQLGILEANKRALENDKDTANTLSGQNTIAEYNNRIKAVKDMIYGLDSTNALSNLLFAVEKAKGYEKVDGQIMQTLRGKDYLDFRQILHNLENGKDESAKIDMIDALKEIDDRFADITDADISYKKVLDDNLVRTYSKDDSFASAVKELHDNYVDIAALQFNIALERQEVALTEDEVAREVNSLHNDMNDIRKQAIMTATDTIMGLVDKYDSENIRKALYDRYTSNKIKEDYFGNTSQNIQDAKVFNDALDILNLKSASNKAIGEDIENLIALHDAIKAGQSEKSTTSQNPIVEPSAQTMGNNSQPTIESSTTQKSGQQTQAQAAETPKIVNENEEEDEEDRLFREVFPNAKPIPKRNTSIIKGQHTIGEDDITFVTYRGNTYLHGYTPDIPGGAVIGGLITTNEPDTYTLITHPYGYGALDIIGDKNFYDRTNVSLTEDFLITKYPIVKYNQKEGIYKVVEKGELGRVEDDKDNVIGKKRTEEYNAMLESYRDVSYEGERLKEGKISNGRIKSGNASTGEVTSPIDINPDIPTADDAFLQTSDDRETNTPDGTIIPDANVEDIAIPDDTGLYITPKEDTENINQDENVLLDNSDILNADIPDVPILEGEPRIDQILYSQLSDTVMNAMSNANLQGVTFDDIFWDTMRENLTKKYRKNYSSESDFNSDLERVIKWGNDLEVLYQSSSSIANVIKTSMIAEKNKGEEIAKRFGESVEKLIEEYKEDISADFINGKYYIKLEDLLRYCTLDDAHAIPNLNADTVGKLLYDSLVKYLQEHPEKYVLLDKNTITDALRNSKLSIEERKEMLKLQNVDYGINFLGRYRYVENNADDTEIKKLLNIFNTLKIGSKIKYKYEFNETNNKYVINFYYDNVQIGYLPTLSRDASNGRFVQYNDGWRTDMDENSNSNLKDLFITWLNNKDNDESITKLNNIILSYAFNTLTDEQKTDLIENFKNNEAVKKAKEDGFTEKNISDERLLLGLSSIWAYSRELSGYSKETTDKIRTDSVNDWFDKVRDSFRFVNSMTELKEGEVVVSKLKDGALIVLSPEERKPISEAINEKIKPNIRVVIGDKNNNFKISGQNNNGSPIQNANIQGAGVIQYHSTGIIIPDRSGNYSFVHGYPIPLKSINDKLPHPAKKLVLKIYDEINTICSGDDAQTVCENLVTFLNKLIGTENNNTALFYSSQCKNIVTKLVNDGSTKINGFEITYFTKDDKGVKLNHTLQVVKQFVNRKTNTYFTHTKGGKEVLASLVDNEYSKIVTGNDAVAEKVIDFLKEYYHFNITHAFVESDNNNKLELNGVASRNKEGKFVITIGKEQFVYNSYNDFIIDNDLMDVTTKQSENGTNFDQNFDAKTEVHPDILIKIKDDSTTPVEDSDTVPNYTPTTQAVIDILNGKHKVKNMGKAIFNEIYKQAFKSLKINGKVFDLLPKSITFVDENAKDFAYSNTGNEESEIEIGDKTIIAKAGEIIVTRRWINMLNESPAKQKEAVRKLIHEQLHVILHQNGNEKYIEQIREIYDEFVAKNTNEDLNQYKYEIYEDENKNKINSEYWKNNKLNEAGLEEFLVESLTSAELAKALNEIQTDTPTTKRKESLFDKIMKFLVDLFGWDIKEGSLYNKEFILLADIIDSKQTSSRSSNKNNNNTKTNVQENVTKKSDTNFETGTPDGDIDKKHSDEEVIKENNAFDKSSYSSMFMRRSSIEEKSEDESKLLIDSYNAFVESVPLNKRSSIVNKIENGQYSMTCK